MKNKVAMGCELKSPKPNAQCPKPKMDLIVTHANADFDALGSLIAAKKLYPNSRLLLPGSQEKAVREFLSLFKDTINIETERDCKLDNIDRLIIVDTKHRSRIGVAASLLDAIRRPEVIIYDHHPRTKYDIPADRDIYKPWGATITILLELIKKKKARFNPMEATLLLLGIYEETGSLTFRTTTRLDVDAVSYLLSKGAKLNMVSSYLKRELGEEELAFLVRLINSTEFYDVNGLNVAIVTVESDKYISELGTLIHKLIDVENLKILFCLIKTGAKISIIARSHIQELDVNRVMKRFGGGGHPAAASAKVDNASMEKLKEKLLEILKKTARIRIYAEDIMSRPHTIPVDATVKDAQNFLTEKKLEAAPVVSQKKLAGIITMRNVQKALRRKYGHSRVKGYMSTNFEAITLKTPVYSIQSLMSKKDPGYLPVLKRGKLVGMVTRSDMVKVLHRGLFVRKVKTKQVLNLKDRMHMVAPRKIMKVLRLIGALAQQENFNAFVVGGFVRDLLFGVKNYDADIVIEGDAIKFGGILRDKVNGSLVIHHKFGTATVVMPWGIGDIPRFKVDIATARKETYKHPAALPDVEFSLLKEDLYRRDFTINAMAVALNKNCFGQLIDFFNGQDDLDSKKIRVLHDKSFIDDPTRIFRAVRFEGRFNFRITRHTQNLIKTAISQDMFGRTEKQRIRDELMLMLKEEDPLKAIKRMHELDELRFIHPKVGLTKKKITLFKSVDRLYRWYNRTPLKKRPLEKGLIYLMALLDDLDTLNAKSLCEKFVFRRSERIRILSYKKMGQETLGFLSRKTRIKPSQIYKKLCLLSYEVIILLAAKAGSDKALARMRDFLLKYNNVRIKIRGTDLEGLGLCPGPRFSEILKKVLYARIDGKISSKKDELELAATLVKK